MTFCIFRLKIEIEATREFHIFKWEDDMKYLVIVNSNLSRKTEWFWAKSRKKINEYFPEYELWFPTTRFFKVPLDINSFDVILLVGDDTFFSCFINSVFYELTPGKKQTKIAFIPDNKKSAITKALGISSRLSAQLDLIATKQSLLLDLVRCHYLDKKGIPRSHFVMNDVVIGMSPVRIPFLIKTVAEIAKNSRFLPFRKKSKQIKLYTEGNKIFEGHYTFSAVMLGRKLINGPAIPGQKKIRCNLTNFDYIQVNATPNQNFDDQVINSNNNPADLKSKYLISRSFEDLTIKAEGQENTVIIDGIHLGKLPATFSFLPKTIRVIAPMIMVRVRQPWHKKVSAAAFPKPIGSRNSLRTIPEDEVCS